MNSLEVRDLDSKSWVSNEFLDVLTCYDLAENGLEKLIFYVFFEQCSPFEDDVVTRLANMCPRISHLELSNMHNLSEAGRLSMVSLFRQIIQNSPPIQVLDMRVFSTGSDIYENMGELVLEAILNSNINSITDLNFCYNSSWFFKAVTR